MVEIYILSYVYFLALKMKLNIITHQLLKKRKEKTWDGFMDILFLCKSCNNVQIGFASLGHQVTLPS